MFLGSRKLHASGTTCFVASTSCASARAPRTRSVLVCSSSSNEPGGVGLDAALRHFEATVIEKLAESNSRSAKEISESNTRFQKAILDSKLDFVKELAEARKTFGNDFAEARSAFRDELGKANLTFVKELAEAKAASVKELTEAKTASAKELAEANAASDKRLTVLVFINVGLGLFLLANSAVDTPVGALLYKLLPQVLGLKGACVFSE
mmetsp:Transcript_20561/g.52196  ORF Transcript_20561/g.52196 Transcript_20561/m.52196 type:complete len:209 (-) Transcript_20561:183-809(-)